MDSSDETLNKLDLYYNSPEKLKKHIKNVGYRIYQLKITSVILLGIIKSILKDM